MRETRVLQEDMLREIGNIGMGNAAISLSELLLETVKISIPLVESVALGDLPDALGGAEQIVAGIYIAVHGDADLHMIFLLPLDSAKRLIEMLAADNAQGFDEIGMSVIAEIGNIITAGYVNALADMTGLRLLPEPPVLAVDIAEAIVGSILGLIQIQEDTIISIKTDFLTKASMIEGFLCMIPLENSAQLVYKTLMMESVQ
jgi:chemotaxis protein CheC